MYTRVKLTRRPDHALFQLAEFVARYNDTEYADELSRLTMMIPGTVIGNFCPLGLRQLNRMAGWCISADDGPAQSMGVNFQDVPWDLPLKLKC